LFVSYAVLIINASLYIKDKISNNPTVYEERKTARKTVSNLSIINDE